MQWSKSAPTVDASTGDRAAELPSEQAAEGSNQARLDAVFGGGDAPPDSRTVKGAGGYVYKQYSDGAIEILAGPRGVGRVLTEGRVWEAITEEIGPFPEQAPGPSPSPVPAPPAEQDDGWLDAIEDTVGEWEEAFWRWWEGDEDEAPERTPPEEDEPAPVEVPAPEDQLDPSKRTIFGEKKVTDRDLGSVRFGEVRGVDFETDDEYYASLDALYAERDQNRSTARTDEQKELLALARSCARDSGALAKLARERGAAGAAMDYSGATLSNEGYTLNATLMSRMADFHLFTVAVGLYTRPVAAVTDAVRPRVRAHQYAVERDILTGQYTDTIFQNLVAMYADPAYRSGDDVVDLHGQSWAKAGHFVDASGAPVGPDGEIDQAGTMANVKGYVDGFNFRSNKTKAASEGWERGDERLPNPTSNEPYLSPHIVGEAIDRDRKGFADGTGSDPIIDYVAWEFGMARRASGEQWHFELTGRPISNETIEEER